MIFPLSHEHTSVRRLPWVTFTIMAICLLAFLLTNGVGGDATEQISRQLDEAMQYFMAHPYLELDSRLADLVFDTTGQNTVDEFKEVFKEFGAEPPRSQFEISEQQNHLDEMVDAAFDARLDLPWYRWGLVPAAKTPHGIITHQFMHGGWLHLIFNMFFLYLAGPYIEDVWGRVIFVSFYLGAGSLAGLAFAFHYPELDFPLVGASGAVAGLMGAFLIRYWSTKIKFFYFFFVFMGTFTAPAWLMLPLWLARELMYADAMDVVGSSGGGVAHWAHVWGFVGGIGVALGLKHYKVEEKYINSVIEGKITLFDNSELDRVLESYRQGQVDESLTQLKEMAVANPDNVDVVTAFWNISNEQGRAEDAGPVVAAAVKGAARRGSLDSFDPVFVELAEQVETPFEPVIAVRLADFLLELDRREEAGILVQSVAGSLTANHPPGLLLKVAKMATDLNCAAAPAVVGIALSNSELPEESRAELQALPTSAPPPKASVVKPEPVQAPPPRTEPPALAPAGPASATKAKIKVMAAIPRKLVDGGVRVKIDEQRRVIAFDQVAAVSVAVLVPAEGRRSILIDLLLDPPGTRRLRLVRFESSGFDPRRLMGGEKPLEAMRAFVAALVEGTSGAVSLPDAARLTAGQFAEFPSLEAYELAVLLPES